MIETIDVDTKFIKSMQKYRLPPKDKGLIEACSNSFVLFCDKMLGLKLYAWQVAFANQLV